MIPIYLAAVFVANLLVTAHPTWSPYIAFALIGLVLVVRDRLHRRWENAGRLALAARMGGLILLGGALSFIAQPTAGRVVLASVAAFIVAEALDGVAFHLAHRRPWVERSNASNVVGAAADSLIFVTVAFYGILPTAVLLQIIALQFIAKVAGGLLWSLALAPRMRAVTA